MIHIIGLKHSCQLAEPRSGVGNTTTLNNTCIYRSTIKYQHSSTIPYHSIWKLSSGINSHVRFCLLLPLHYTDHHDHPYIPSTIQIWRAKELHQIQSTRLIYIYLPGSTCKYGHVGTQFTGECLLSASNASHPELEPNLGISHRKMIFQSRFLRFHGFRSSRVISKTPQLASPKSLLQKPALHFIVPGGPLAASSENRNTWRRMDFIVRLDLG